MSDTRTLETDKSGALIAESVAAAGHVIALRTIVPDELTVRTQVLAVGRDSSGSQVQIAYAIAGSSLEPVTVTQRRSRP